MAGNQNSNKKRSTVSGAKSSGGRRTSSSSTRGRAASGSRRAGTGGRSGSGSRRTASGSSRRNADKKEQGYTEPIADEIKLIAVLAVSILALLSVFGLGGRVGDRAAYLLFGLFGILAYVLPFAVFIGTAFHMSNRGSRIAHVKIGAALVLLVMIMALVAVSDTAFDGTGKVTEGFLTSAASHDGGGLIGYSLAWLLYSAFGRIGATVVFVGIMLISGVLITGRRLFVQLGQFIWRMMSELGGKLQDYREDKAEERLRSQEELEAQADLEDPEADDVDEADGEDGIIFKKRPGRKKKAANIVMNSAQPSEGEQTKEQPADKTAAALSALLLRAESGNALQADKPVSQAGASREHLDSFDHGQSIQPLHIKVPEFMKGGKLHESNMRPGNTGLSASGLSTGSKKIKDTISGEGAAAHDIVTANDKADKAAATAKEKPHIRTSLTVEDLQLEIEGLEEDEDEDVFMGQASEVHEASQVHEASEKHETSELHEDPEIHDAEPQEIHRAAPKRRASANASDGTAEPLEIIEEEVEKYEFPPIELLEKGSNGGSQQSAASLRQTALKLQQTFESFGVGVQVTNASCGPAVTRYELQPDQGVKVSKIVSLADDIKLNLAVADIRIEAPIPGKAAVGIEVPNTHKEMVRLRDLLESDKAQQMKSKLAFVVGKDIGGQPVMADIEKMPHLLIAGATGSGKSVCINTIIMSILYRADPNEVKMIMVDPKVVELNVYNGLPHLLIPVVTDPKKAAGALNWAVTTMMERYNKFAEIGAKDLKSYNARVENVAYESQNHKKMPQIVIIIDELADLMMVAQSEVEDAICRLAQLARAAGIHLVIATQRPSVNVITGLIKANVPSRIAFSVSSGVDSRTILDMNGAEKLLGNGDMLFYPQGLQKPVRVQGAFVSETEIGQVTDFIKAHMSSKPVYNEEIKNRIENASVSAGPSAGGGDRDIYFAEAGRFVIEKEKASIGMLQRVYKIGFNRAARIMDQLSDAGVVGPEIGTKPRQILMTMEEFEQFISENES